MSMGIMLVGVLGMLLAVPAAQAQLTYRCSNGTTSYLSDRPCSITPKTTIGTYGPVAAPPAYSPPLPGAPKAQEHVKFLSPMCASISEGIRTGPSRGVRNDVIQGLHEEYRQRCALEDQDARAQLQHQQAGEQRVRLAQRESANSARESSARLSQRCDGMRDVIALKRKRELDLNAKEVEALRDLERTYNGTCLAR